MKKIGFCFIGHVAHVRHMLPIAVELSKFDNFKVDLMLSSRVVYREVQAVLSLYSEHKCEVVFKKSSIFKRFTARIKKKLYANNKSLVKKIKISFLVMTV